MPKEETKRRAWRKEFGERRTNLVAPGGAECTGSRSGPENSGSRGLFLGAHRIRAAGVLIPKAVS